MNEFDRLKEMLDRAGITYTESAKGCLEVRGMYGNVIVSAICTEYSIGGSEGLIEIDGLLHKGEGFDGITGNLRADDVFERIEKRIRYLERKRAYDRERRRTEKRWFNRSTSCRICHNAPRMIGGTMCKRCVAAFEEKRK